MATSDEIARLRAEMDQGRETMRELAGTAHAFFSGCTLAGFSEDQALYLTQTWLTTLIQTAPMSGMADQIREMLECKGEPFPETTADGAEPTESTYLERVTLPEREQAVARLVEEFGMTPEAFGGLHPIFMRWTGGEMLAWVECPADHPDAVPFWKDDPYWAAELKEGER